MEISAQGKSGKSQLPETQLTQLESRKLSLEKFQGSGYTAAGEVVGGDIRVSEYSAPADPPPTCLYVGCFVACIFLFFSFSFSNFHFQFSFLIFNFKYSAPVQLPPLSLCRIFRGLLHLLLFLIFMVLNCKLTV